MEYEIWESDVLLSSANAITDTATLPMSVGLNYFVVVNDGFCTNTSNTVTSIAENVPPPAIIADGALNFCSGTTLSLSINSDGGTALQFDGVNDRVTGKDENLPTGQSDFTIEGWIKPAVVNQNAVIFSFGDTTTSSRVEMRYVNGFLAIGGSSGFQAGTTPIDTGVWTHVAISGSPYGFALTCKWY